MLENIIISIAVTFVMGFPLSVYAGVIVARYWAFETALNQARSIIFTLEQIWEYRYLDVAVPDPDSSTGRRTVFVSKDISRNDTMWQLLLIGLQLKEGGHWEAAKEVDAVALQIEEMRKRFISECQFAVNGGEKEITEYIADWHRKLSSKGPALWLIFKPWPNKRYQNLSCVSVDETTGEWHELEPVKDRKSAEGV